MNQEKTVADITMPTCWAWGRGEDDAYEGHFTSSCPGQVPGAGPWVSVQTVPPQLPAQ